MSGKPSLSHESIGRICGPLFISLLLVFCLSVCLYRVGQIFYVEFDEYMRVVVSRFYFSRLFGSGQCTVQGFAENCIKSPYFLLMMSPYRGAFVRYFTFPFAAFFAPAFGFLVACKIAEAFLFFVSLLSFWHVIRYVAGRMSAFLCVIFVVVNLAYMMSFRYALGLETGFQIVGFWLGLVFLVRFSASGKSRWLYGAMFVFGLTLWTKIMFMAYVLGCLAGLAVLGRSGRKILFSKALPLSRKNVFIGIAAFLAGAFPLLFFNLLYRFETVTYLCGAAMDSGAADGWNNSDLLGNFARRIGDVYAYLSGTVVSGDATLFPVGLFLAALVWACGYLCFSGKRNALWYLLAFMLTAYFTVMVLSCFLPAGHDPYHILIMAPFFELLCALFVAFVLRYLKSRILSALLLCLVVFCWSFGFVGKTVTFVKTVNAGTAPQFYYIDELDSVVDGIDPASDNLCSDLFVGFLLQSAYPDMRVYIFDSRLRFLPDVLTAIKSRDSDGRNYLLISDKPDREEILRMCKRRNCRPVLEKTFNCINGVSLFRYRLDMD